MVASDPVVNDVSLTPYLGKKYAIIYADPPWDYDFGTAPTCRGAGPYARMSLENLCNMPVGDIAAKSAVLFLWCTGPKEAEGAHTRVMEAWGFKPITLAFDWVKTLKENSRPFIGTGHWTRANSEQCWFAKRGEPKCVNHAVRQVVSTHVLEHSKKPPIFRKLILQLMGNLPRVELFARQKVPGWDCWGNEVESAPALLEFFKPWYAPSPGGITKYAMLGVNERSLTDQVATLVAQGMKPGDVALKLGVSANTVRVLKHRILAKEGRGSE